MCNHQTGAFHETGVNTEVEIDKQGPGSII